MRGNIIFAVYIQRRTQSRDRLGDRLFKITIISISVADINRNIAIDGIRNTGTDIQAKLFSLSLLPKFKAPAGVEPVTLVLFLRWAKLIPPPT